jgi:hypothetical protein
MRRRYPTSVRLPRAAAIRSRRLRPRTPIPIPLPARQQPVDAHGLHSGHAFHPRAIRAAKRCVEVSGDGIGFAVAMDSVPRQLSARLHESGTQRADVLMQDRQHDAWQSRRRVHPR